MTYTNRMKSRRWLLKWKRRRTEPWMLKLVPYQREILTNLNPIMGYWHKVKYLEIQQPQPPQPLFKEVK